MYSTCVKKMIISGLLIISVNLLFAQQKFSSGALSVSIDGKGNITSMESLPAGKNLAPRDSTGVLLQLVKEGKRYKPLAAVFTKNTIALHYPDKQMAKISVTSKKAFLRFELIEISKEADAVIWGPFNTSLAGTIGNTVGVVRSSAFAIGMLALNTKTTGGELVNDEGAVYERGTTAVKKDFGSALQAFTVNRSRDRVITVWNSWKNVPVKGIPEGKPEGSAIAIFGGKPSDVLSIISAIEQTEGLPHPLWKKEWIRQSALTGRPYMITSFSEETIDTLLRYAKSMGLEGIYHEGPFSTWGNFELDKKLFPNGIKGFAKCVQKAHALDLRLGFHTLTTFITTNDAYVTPKPHPHLATAGSSLLQEAIDEHATVINILSPAYFEMRSDLNSIRIGDEIIRFRAVSNNAPYQLLDCVRGAFGTQKSNHPKGAAVSRLIDHPYKVFFPDWILQKEIAGNIARFINDTGADQLDFDGHEGTYATGMGNLSLEGFAEDVYKAIKHPVVFGSSRSGHYFWHMNDYLNWGEPWYGGFRESQSDYRIDNQVYYENNYMPNMLGWFLITSQTKPEDVDWMLARAAGYHAGYALVVRYDAVKNNPFIHEIVEQVNSWTEAQQKNAFSPAQKQWLKIPENDVHLQRDGSNAWKMYRYKKITFEHLPKVLQPGEPTSSEWTFENKTGKQNVQLVLLAAGDKGEISNPVIELDNSLRIQPPLNLKAGQSLVIDHSDTATLYDQKGKFVKKVVLTQALPELSEGNHHLLFDGTFTESADIKVKITLKLLDGTEKVQAK
ncbi:hypothetical protein [Agriterribacter sp.]|uniref:hypothetical protein n=1 Tax=Agriterribacter sp. TaxID=2821509 RepID=UPI002B9616B7|nr:hypothetical protein [Agriterribacter sp.]HTN08727.1 hypothetical protein [Agriterribacter sp.]